MMRVNWVLLVYIRFEESIVRSTFVIFITVALLISSDQ